MNKIELLQRGMALVDHFIRKNNLPPVIVTPVDAIVGFDACAYYRKDQIVISASSCASKAVPNAVRNWNWPGSTIDRTPYGVMCHELGHHVDFHTGRWNGRYSSDYSVNVRKLSGEKAITSYCPNDAEWFAEIFRLFVTNPDLLKSLRPNAYTILSSRFTPVVNADWLTVLKDAPGRILSSHAKKMKL